jgi:ABC-type Na+ efflux pump permease subunit
MYYKILVIARREYRAAVRSKSFIITLVLMPVLMTGSIAIQALFKKLDDQTAKTFVVIDRSGGKLDEFLFDAAEQHNLHEIFEPGTKKQIQPEFQIKVEPPSDNTPEAIHQQRYELSQQVEQDKYAGIVEIGPKVFELHEPGAKTTDEDSIRFQAKKPTQQEFMIFARRVLNDGIQIHRLKQEGIDPIKVKKVQQPVDIKYRALTRKELENKPEDAAASAQIANFLLPSILIGLMFMVIMVGATPAMQGVVEEKSQRIAEVLLGSVTPFQLMAGKLVGLIGVSMTMAIVYLVGGYVVADRYGMAAMFSVGLMVWFVVFQILALLIFGSLFISIGAAAADIKDTQTLLMPVMLIACLPFFAMPAVLQDPNGKIAVICSFFPFATPMMLVARQSVPPGVPVEQMILGIALVLLTTLFCIWAAGKIFRVGILMQGKGAKFKDLVRWVWKG